jgi:hypothetical protein
MKKQILKLKQDIRLLKSKLRDCHNLVQKLNEVAKQSSASPIQTPQLTPVDAPQLST